MNDPWRSMILGTGPLWLIAAAAGVLTGLRAPAGTERDRNALVALFLAGVAVQCGHVLEEYHTGFWNRWPEFLGLVAWTPQFFITFNVVWIAFWCASAAGVLAGWRLAYVPLWFFAIGMTGNGIWHPLLALAAGGYFPGLWTSPFTGVIGVAILLQLGRYTRR